MTTGREATACVADACAEPPSLQQNLTFPSDKVEGETLSVQCAASRGELPITFTWKLNGERNQLHDTRGIQIQVRVCYNLLPQQPPSLSFYLLTSCLSCLLEQQ